ncbi:MAG: hypothetical protein ACTHLA_04295 [Asticcacaulis sp.]|uniref:hypothetical protein n=1 Tax=Asticcacaulis sp. TaxID=1872648 RepID=UPI003F7B4F3C
MIRSVLRLSVAAVALIGLLAAPIAFAQDENGDDDDDTDAVMTAAIGCVATYDLVLARGLAGQQVADVQQARAQAREVYKEAAQLDDDQVDADIAQADAKLPDLLDDGNVTLQKYRHICDQLLSDDDGADLPQATGA